MDLKPVVSIVIPCYNSGAYLPEALASIAACPQNIPYEVVIVNDGSTDQSTLDLLRFLSVGNYTVIDQENKGPAAARNTGIRVAKGEYILFLDSDNKIRTDYIEKAVEILASQPNVGVVHSDAHFFGDTDKPRFQSRSFDLFDIIEENYIDICSVIRKKVWEDVSGLDETRLLIGHEDWEFWIRIGATAWKFYYIAEALFDYRVRKDSLVVAAIEPINYQRMQNYVLTKNVNIVMNCYRYVKDKSKIYEFDQRNPLRSFVKYSYNKYLKKIFYIKIFQIFF